MSSMTSIVDGGSFTPCALVTWIYQAWGETKLQTAVCTSECNGGKKCQCHPRQDLSPGAPESHLCDHPFLSDFQGGYWLSAQVSQKRPKQNIPTT